MIEGKKILVTATSIKTRGGITSVIKAHREGEQWDKFQCKWIETHIDKNIFFKIFYFLKSLLLYILNIPFYDLVHIHMSEPVSAFRKLIFLWFAKLFGKKVIVHFHSFSAETTIRGQYPWLYKYLFTRANLVLVLSEYWKKELINTFQIDGRIETLYNPCSDPIMGHQYSKKKNILYAGTLNKRKGYLDLINAFSQIAYKYPEWKLIFAGNGDLDKGKDLVRNLSFSNQVEFLGWVNGIEKDKVFQEATIFCLPSYAEGFPMAVLDAWSYELPVITTPVGGLPDILENKKNALVFSPGDRDALAVHLDNLISNDDLRNTIKIESKYLSKNVFNKNEINNQLKKLYTRVLLE